MKSFSRKIFFKESRAGPSESQLSLGGVLNRFQPSPDRSGQVSSGSQASSIESRTSLSQVLGGSQSISTGSQASLCQVPTRSWAGLEVSRGFSWVSVKSQANFGQVPDGSKWGPHSGPVGSQAGPE
jgi:hypothetical protein